MTQYLAQTKRIPVIYVLRSLYSLTGVFPLFVFILLYLSFSATILFGSKQAVQTIIDIQSLPVITAFELLFISLPLLFHFCNGVWSFLIDWGITANGISQKISFIFCVIIFVMMALAIGLILLFQLYPKFFGA